MNGEARGLRADQEIVSNTGCEALRMTPTAIP